MKGVNITVSAVTMHLNTSYTEGEEMLFILIRSKAALKVSWYG